MLARTTQKDAQPAAKVGTRRLVPLYSRGPSPPPAAPAEMPFPLTPVRFWTHEPMADASVANVSTAPSNGSSTAHSLTSDIGQLCETKPPNRVILFLHIYKTGGTSNRLLFQHWAEECGMSYAQAGSCPEGAWMSKLPEDNTEYICLHGAGKHRFPTPRSSQRGILPLVDVIAGHMAYGFHKHIQKKYTYITCLRNPMARFVSGLLYEQRKVTSGMNLTEAIDYVALALVVVQAGLLYLIALKAEGLRGPQLLAAAKAVHAGSPRPKARLPSEGLVKGTV